MNDFNRKYWLLHIPAHAVRDGRTIDSLLGWLHANGMRPIDVQRYHELLMTLGVVPQPIVIDGPMII